MPQKLSNLFNLINKLGLEVEGWNMDARKDRTYHELKHSFKEEVIVPMVALTNSYDFFIFASAEKILRLADGTECVVEQYEEKHICDLEDDIKRLYNVDAWSFIKRWHKYDSMMTNMMFLKMVLRRYEDRVNE